MNNKHYYIITLKMPDGINYFCGMEKYNSGFFPTWHTEKICAVYYEDKNFCKRRLSFLKKFAASSNSKMKAVTTIPEGADRIIKFVPVLPINK